MLNEEQRQTFRATGLLRLPGAIPAAVVADMRERVWAGFDRAGLPRRGPPGIEGADLRRAVKRLRKTGGLERLYTERNPEAVASVADARELLDGAEAERSRPLLLLTLPSGGDEPWRVPHNIWHTDCPRLPGGGAPGIIVLAFVDTVRPTGGGTVVIQGSHRLLESTESGLSSRQLKKRLKHYPFFSMLFRKEPPECADRHRYLLDEPHCVAGVPVQAVELTGEPGDMVLVDGRILHTVAPNCLDAPRLMARGFFASERLASAWKVRDGA